MQAPLRYAKNKSCPTNINVIRFSRKNINDKDNLISNIETVMYDF